MTIPTFHLSGDEIETIRYFYQKYGCTFTSLILGVSRKSIIKHCQDIENPSREEVNKLIIELIKEHEFEK
ncbi:hypothetical protein L4D00_23400 [Photobacterium swingsii]|uniref:hypothetical protein n=1 Tax=Photobacterium swingsii TaxID=680026 RepID=UPI003D14BFB4